MAAEDNPQPVRGILQEGDARASDQFHQATLPGLDLADNHRHLPVRAEGDAASDGQPALVGKSYTSGNLKYLKTTEDGEIVANIGAEKSDYVEGSATALSAASPSWTTIVTETVGADTKYLSVEVSGVGSVEVEVRSGVTASEALVVRKHLTSSNPDRTITFPAPHFLASGKTMLVRAKNHEPGGPSANKDVVVHATLFKEA